MDVMSFTDSPGTRVDPAGLSGAFLMSGVIVLGIATAAPDLIANLPEPPLVIARIFNPPPKPIDKPVERLKTPTKETHVTATKPPPAGPTTGNGSTVIGTGPGPEIIKPGPGPEIIVDPPKPLPVRTTAQLAARDAAQPPYPRSLQADGIEGVAIVRVLVGTDGRVRAVESVRADDPLFFEATRDQALRKWRFKPATEDGRPIESWREMTVRFVIPR
jgi:protein TonB